MHTAKLHQALHCIGEEFDSGKVIEKLSQLHQALDTSVQSPSEKNTKAFHRACAQLKKLLQSSPTNLATPSTGKIFKRIGALPYIGQGLWAQVSATLDANTMSPADAKKQMGQLAKQLTKFSKSLKTMHTKLHDLDIDSQPLPSGQACLGITIPPQLVGSNLEGLATEIHEFDDALKTFQKIVAQKVASLKVSSLGSAGFQLFLQVSPAFAQALAVSIERIASIYNNLLQIKKLQADLAKQNVPAQRIQTIAEHESDLLENGLSDLAQTLLDEHLPKSAKSRAKDLKIALEEDLRFLADRIDHGVLLEVQINPPESASANQKKAAQLTNTQGRALADLQKQPGPIFSPSDASSPD